MSADRIALSGYYGFANAGDEAVLAGLLLALRERSTEGAPPAIDVLSISPAVTERDHPVHSSHRYRAAALVRSIARCDLLASGGGSLLQDVTSRHSIFYYLGVVRAAQILGKRSMFIAQGIGPLLQPRSQRLTAAVARRCDAITVRDMASAELLRRIGVDRPPIVVTADPALLLTPPHGDAEPKDGIALSLRSWPDAPPGLTGSVARACRSSAAGARLRSMQMSPTDGAVHREFLSELSLPYGADGGLDWRSASEVAAGAEMVIGMRLHALILAAASGVPALALAYDPKVRAFMEQSGQGDAVIDVRGSDETAIGAAVARVWSERAARSAALRAALPSLREAAYKNADTALSLLQ